MPFQIEKIDFVFDEQGIEQRARPCFDEFKFWDWPGASLVGHLDWRSDEDELPLQASDLIAWRVRRKLASDGPVEKQMSLLDKPSAFVYVFDEQDVLEFVNKVHENVKRIRELRNAPNEDAVR